MMVPVVFVTWLMVVLAVTLASYVISKVVLLNRLRRCGLTRTGPEL